MTDPAPAPKPPSPGYLRFVASVTGPDPAYREEVDEEALLALEKDERRAAEDLLIQRLDVDDRRAPPALARARCRGAVMPMKRRLPKANPRMRIAIAQALTDLEAVPGPDDAVVEALRSGDEDAGISALSAAEGLGSPEIREALLWAAEHHPSPAVRGNAGAQLIHRAGVTDDPLAWEMRPLWLRLGDDDPEVRAAAFAELCQVIGLTPGEPG